MDYLKLPDRVAKTRSFGITSVHDVGVSIGDLRNLLADYGDYLDMAKLGIGSAYVTPRLREKVEVYREHGVVTYFGGTLFEKFHYQGRLDEYRTFMREMGVEWVEVSTGTLELSLAERLDIVRRFLDDFVVLAEVGSKDVERVMPPAQWIEETQALLEAGCRYVITEGRDSGTAGVFRPSGELRTDLVMDLAAHVDPKQLIFEAPTAKAQMFFINMLGSNVNLGNVSPWDLLQLEAQRCGLRNETFFVGEGDGSRTRTPPDDGLEPRR